MAKKILTSAEILAEYENRKEYWGHALFRYRKVNNLSVAELAEALKVPVFQLAVLARTKLPRKGRLECGLIGANQKTGISCARLECLAEYAKLGKDNTDEESGLKQGTLY